MCFSKIVNKIIYQNTREGKYEYKTKNSMCFVWNFYFDFLCNEFNICGNN